MNILLVFVSFAWLCFSLDNGLSLTPPMGWSSRDSYGCQINENIVKRTADLLVQTKLAQKGYKYVIIEGCWQGGRNETTQQLFPDMRRFPSGIKKLADYIHSKGLLLGVSSDAGAKTCEGLPGSYKYEQVDAITFAKWEIDYLTYQNCYSNVQQGLFQRYHKMQKELNKTGRQIFFAMNAQGENKPWIWTGNYANSWRTTQNMHDSWKSFSSVLDRQAKLQGYAGKGGWNDPDILQVGNGGMTYNEYQVHFTMWAFLKAPLIIGCRLEDISQSILQILGNKQIISIGQDSFGLQATRKTKQIRQQGTVQIWITQLTHLRWAIALVNLSQNFSDVQVNLYKMIDKKFHHYDIRNVIEQKDEGRSSDQYIIDTISGRSVNAYILIFDSVQQNSKIVLEAPQAKHKNLSK